MRENMDTLVTKQKLQDSGQESPYTETLSTKDQLELGDYELDELANKTAGDGDTDVDVDVHILQNSAYEDDGFKITSDESSSSSKIPWLLTRRRLMDKVTLLESTVQKYRTQVASSFATITAKEMTISRLETEATGLREELKDKERTIKQLESELLETADEKTKSENKLDMMLEELENIDLNATTRLLPISEKSSSTADYQHNHGALKRQRSSFSFFGYGMGGNQNKLRGLLRRRANSDTGTPSEMRLNADGSIAKTDNDNLVNITDDLADTHVTYLQDNIGSTACQLM